MIPRNLSKEQFKEILGRYVNSQSPPNEERFIEQWYNALGSNNQLRLDETGHKEIEDKLWNAISDRIKNRQNQELENDVHPFNYRKALSIAAAILIFISSSVFYWGSIKSDTNNKKLVAEVKEELILQAGSELRRVALEDGTKVTLQPNSRLRIKDFLGASTREVYLEGEAFFEVAHDKEHPFLVYTGEITTKVLGTSFTITARDFKKAIEVSVKTGRVSVTKTQQMSSSPLHILTEEIILSPNQKAIYDGNKVIAALVEKPRRIQLDGKQQPLMRFDEEPVVNILNAIRKVYGVDIVFDKQQLDKCLLTTTLSDEDMYDRLNIICKAINGTYTLEGTQIIIKSKGCQTIN